MRISRIKHLNVQRCKLSIYYFYLLLIVLIIQFTYAQCVLSNFDNVMWNITSNPVKFGYTNELSCYIADGNNSCTQRLRQWVGGQQYTSLCQNMKCADDKKYHVKVKSPCSYTLMISNFSIVDVNCDYSCLYGTKSYRKKLQLNSHDFISVPRVQHKNVSLTGGYIDIQVYLEDVFPSPKCQAFLMGTNITNYLLVVLSREGYFYDVELGLFFHNILCSGNVTIDCRLGKEQITVLNQYIGDCTDIDTSHSIVLEVAVATIMTIFVGVVGSCVLFVCYFWRKRRRLQFNYHTACTDYPGPPNDLKVSKIDESEITIEWGPPSADDGSTVGDYKIYIKSETTGEKWKNVETVGALKNDFTFTQLKTNDKYYIGVAACNEVGESPIAETDKTYSLKERKNLGRKDNKTTCSNLMKCSATKKRYVVRIMIVGRKSVGKTCLLRRLLQRNMTNVSSTDGVDINVNRFKINIADGEWKIEKDQIDETIKHNQSIKEEMTELEEDCSDCEPNRPMVSLSKARATNTRHTSYLDSVSSSVKDIRYKGKNQYATIAEKDNSLKENEDDMHYSLALTLDSMSMTSTSNMSSNLYASCGLWDFAGQREFYATHQAFLTSSAVYLVVADISDDIYRKDERQCFADFQNVGEYIDFWFDSIHCLQTVEQSMDELLHGHIHPPVIMVFTGIDKYEKTNIGENSIHDRKRKLQHELDIVFGQQQKYHHLRKIVWLSNTTDTDEVFADLRLEISAAAMKMKNWGLPVPLKWIVLENFIEMNKKDGKNFLSLSEMVSITQHRDIGILDIEEVMLFLRIQHESGTVIFFEDIRDCIILNPNWLVDAFRCLVSHHTCDRLLHCPDGTLFARTGEISTYLIDELFKLKSGNQFSEQREYLINVMLKFDILVKNGESGSYIMPSMMPSISFDNICKQIGLQQQICKRTSWLCLKFAFLPPAYFNHLSVHFLRMYKPSKIDNKHHSMKLFRGICIFDIDDSSVTKLLVTTSTDIVALQLLSFSSTDTDFGSICSKIRKDILQSTISIERRYRLNIVHELHFKCNTDNYYEDTMSYMALKKSTEYYCNEHCAKHQSEDIYMPWMMNTDEIQ